MNQLTVHKKEYSKDQTDQGELYVAFEFGNKQSARIEGRSRQIEASRLRKPLARFKSEGVTNV
jgi:hypothetical protein